MRESIIDLFSRLKVKKKKKTNHAICSAVLPYRQIPKVPRKWNLKTRFQGDKTHNKSNLLLKWLTEKVNSVCDKGNHTLSPLTYGIFKMTMTVTSFLSQKSLKVHHTICRMSAFLRSNKIFSRFSQCVELEFLFYWLVNHFTKYTEQQCPSCLHNKNFIKPIQKRESNRILLCLYLWLIEIRSRLHIGKRHSGPIYF